MIINTELVDNAVELAQFLINTDTRYSLTVVLNFTKLKIHDVTLFWEEKTNPEGSRTVKVQNKELSISCKEKDIKSLEIEVDDDDFTYELSKLLWKDE